MDQVSRIDTSRTTAMGLWRYAKDFAYAASMLATSAGDGQLTTVKYFLASHSIELSLKAFLRARGLGIDHIRKSFGHDLNKLHSKAKSMGLNRIVCLDEDEVEAIKDLGRHHKSHLFRYIETGTIEVPIWLRTEALALKLVEGLQTFAVRNTLGRAR